MSSLLRGRRRVDARFLPAGRAVKPRRDRSHLDAEVPVETGHVHRAEHLQRQCRATRADSRCPRRSAAPRAIMARPRDSTNAILEQHDHDRLRAGVDQCDELVADGLALVTSMSPSSCDGGDTGSVGVGHGHERASPSPSSTACVLLGRGRSVVQDERSAQPAVRALDRDHGEHVVGIRRSLESAQLEDRHLARGYRVAAALALDDAAGARRELRRPALSCEPAQHLEQCLRAASHPSSSSTSGSCPAPSCGKRRNRRGRPGSRSVVVVAVAEERSTYQSTKYAPATIAAMIAATRPS